MELTLETEWKTEIKGSLRTAEQLNEAGFIRTEEIPRYQRLLARYKFLLPPYYASLIEPGNENCPIRLQAIPSLRELDEAKDQNEFFSDPLNDLDHQPARRVTHRYANRALLHLTPNCSMYCRFCFRKGLLNELSERLFQGPLAEALAYFVSHPEIQEVIFSGGDPFMVSDELLTNVTESLASIDSIRRIRFHSRVPVTLPSRVTRALAQAITSTRLPCTVVTHFNHPKEVTPKSTAAVLELKQHGIVLLNQTVLLNGVNDDAHVLSELNLALGDLGVMPYYLHHPDRAAGTQYFDLSYERGLSIYEKLRARLPGYLLPKYVVDLPDYAYKVEVSTILSRFF
jgi:lysine 2,3-aminomutase